MKYNWENMTDLQKDKAVRDELKLETNNGTTKDDLTEIMRYQAGKIEAAKEYCKQCPAPYFKQEDYSERIAAYTMAEEILAILEGTK